MHCFLVWAGGVDRRPSLIGVHRPYFDPKEYAKLSIDEAQQTYNRMLETVKGYLKEMDIPESVVRKMLAASSDRIAELNSADFQSLENGQNEALDELIIAKCGGMAGIDKFSEEWEKLVLSGARCNKDCQRSMDAHNKAAEERGKCAQSIVDVKSQQEAMASYLRMYGN